MSVLARSRLLTRFTGDPSSRGGIVRRAAAAGVLGRGISLVSALVLTPIVIRGAGVEVYGVYAVVTGLAGLGVVSDLGVGAGLVQRLSQAFGRDDGASAQRLVATAAGLLTAIGIAAALVLVAGALLLPTQSLLGAENLPEQEVVAAACIFAVALGLGLPTILGDRILVATNRGAQAAGWVVVGQVLGLSLTAVIASAGGSLPAIVAATVVTPRLVAAVQTVVVFRSVAPELRPERRRMARAEALMLRSAGALFFVQALVALVAFESDLLVIAAVLGAEQAALASVNMKLIALVGSLSVIASAQVLPIYARALESGELAWIKGTFRRLSAVVIGYAVVSGAVLFVVVPPFVGWWVGDSLKPPTALLAGLVLWAVYTTSLLPCNLLMNAALVVRPQIIAALAMMAINLPLSIVLANRIGVAGPIWGSLIAHVLVSLPVTIVLTRRILRGQGIAATAATDPARPSEGDRA